MARVVHFEIPAVNLESAAEFYSNVFGWNIQKWDGPIEYWMVKTGDAPEMGMDGGIYKKGNLEETINTIGVENLEETINSVKENGGQLFGEILTIPNVGIMAYCLDREGIKFGLMQPFEMMK